MGRNKQNSLKISAVGTTVVENDYFRYTICIYLFTIYKKTNKATGKSKAELHKQSLYFSLLSGHDILM